jgi:hypothetical protein
MEYSLYKAMGNSDEDPNRETKQPLLTKLNYITFHW